MWYVCALLYVRRHRAARTTSVDATCARGEGLGLTAHYIHPFLARFIDNVAEDVRLFISALPWAPQNMMTRQAARDVTARFTQTRQQLCSRVCPPVAIGEAAASCSGVRG